MRVPRVLVIAGSDSSGGAGLEADQKVLAVHGVYAMTATTALTAQNTMGVEDVHITPPEFVRKQLNACLQDIQVDVVKIGMLASVETISVASEALRTYAISTIVLDPVMVATSGAQLLPHNAVKLLRQKLLPITTLLTPNILEATLLARDAGADFNTPNSLEDVKALAKVVHGLGPQAVLLKGGHIPMNSSYLRATADQEPDLIVDVLYDGSEYTIIESIYLKSKNTHGTGCSLASAIAANLAVKASLQTAVRNACRYVGAGIKTSKDIGGGNGPINHFHSVQILPFTSGSFIPYLLDRPDVKPLWKAFTQHKFARAMADGTLPVELFKQYLVQDYLYLTQFARTNALAAYKSKSMDDISASAQIIKYIQHEMELHLDYCKGFGLSKEDIEGHTESKACVAYSRYVLDVGNSEDWLALQIALASCLIGYGETAQLLQRAEESKKESNPYWKWVENYVAKDYQEAVMKGSELIEKHIAKVSPSRIEELVKIFIRVTEMEIDFWEIGTHATREYGLE